MTKSRWLCKLLPLRVFFETTIARSDSQAEAAEHVCEALRAYDVQAVDTLIGLISPPAELMQTLTDRKIAQEQQKT